MRIKKFLSLREVVFFISSKLCFLCLVLYLLRDLNDKNCPKMWLELFMIERNSASSELSNNSETGNV